MRIQVLYPHDFRSGRMMVHYPPGEYTVKREWGEEMVAKGVAKELDPPRADAVEKKAKK